MIHIGLQFWISPVKHIPKVNLSGIYLLLWHRVSSGLSHCLVPLNSDLEIWTRLSAWTDLQDGLLK